jgi:hypothetical protein
LRFSNCDFIRSAKPGHLDFTYRRTQNSILTISESPRLRVGSSTNINLLKRSRASLSHHVLQRAFLFFTTES